MKRGLVFAVFCVSIILMLSVSIVSAGWWSEITGKIIRKSVLDDKEQVDPAKKVCKEEEISYKCSLSDFKSEEVCKAMGKGYYESEEYSMEHYVGYYDIEPTCCHKTDTAWICYFTGKLCGEVGLRHVCHTSVAFKKACEIVGLEFFKEKYPDVSPVCCSQFTKDSRIPFKTDFEWECYFDLGEGEDTPQREIRKPGMIMRTVVRWIT